MLSAKKARQLKIQNQKAQHNSHGKVVKPAPYQSRDIPDARIAPNRKWFSNSRVISQDALSSFRAAMAQTKRDPNTYLLRSNKLPLSLIKDTDGQVLKSKHLIETASFGDTFGPQAQRKRPTISVASFPELAATAESYEETLNEVDSSRDFPIEAVFSKGQGHRLWSELHKVVDASDVILAVLDARDPEQTRCRAIEEHLRKETPHKHLIFVLNKVDLIPTKVAARWVSHLSKEYPTIAFHASVKNSFGRGTLISLLRQFRLLHSDRKQISVGIVGMPNTGKSSLINTLIGRKVCNSAPRPGETQYW